jgi:hypothetical protein
MSEVEDIRDRLSAHEFITKTMLANHLAFNLSEDASDQFKLDLLESFPHPQPGNLMTVEKMQERASAIRAHLRDLLLKISDQEKVVRASISQDRGRPQ